MGLRMKGTIKELFKYKLFVSFKKGIFQLKYFSHNFRMQINNNL